ncbi:hypothetical protein [Arthrobacter sp. L77]|uniref:hypothetical protein n=1 Tax=Arthrobacter sp. L77 TaxID=1496689 RepID=UPI00068CF1FE
MSRQRNGAASAATAADGTGRASGPGRLLIAVYGVFALAATARAAFQIATKFGEAPLAYLLSAAAALVYIVATISLARPGARAYRVSVVAVTTELVGVVTVGLLSVFDAQAFPSETVWSAFGRGYGFVPLVLPILGLLWLRRNRPGRA